MPRFWSYITRGPYSVGCTGQSVYVCRAGQELARLKGFLYTYQSCIAPDLALFALKSNTGILYLYSLPDISLLAKKRFIPDTASQDAMFTFSADGRELISVDSYHVHNCLSVYSLPTLALRARFFDDSDTVEPMDIELTDEPNTLYALMGERNEDGIVRRHFVATLRDGEIAEKVYVTENEYDWYHGYMHLKQHGFTEKAKEWSGLRYGGYDLSGIETRHYSLAELFRYYTQGK